MSARVVSDTLTAVAVLLAVAAPILGSLTKRLVPSLVLICVGTLVFDVHDFLFSGVVAGSIVSATSLVVIGYSVALARACRRFDAAQAALDAQRATTAPASPDCVFCDIIAGRGIGARGCVRIVREWDDALAIVPLDPVVDGHLIVMPKTHVSDADDQGYAASTINRAAALGAELYPAFDVISSAGEAAASSNLHPHSHILPRADGDLPQPSQQPGEEADHG